MRLPGGGELNSKWDAFISYASIDRSIARRIQRFLESYKDPLSRRQLKVFLDTTDLRSGELGRTLADELKLSRKLVVCASRATADSRWVDKELYVFRSTRGDQNIAVVLLNGRPDQVAPPAADGGTYRWHDLRGAFGFLPFSRTRLELLRLLAFIADVDLRKVINWRRRRTIQQLAAALPVAAGCIASVALFPMTSWTSMQLGRPGLPQDRIRPIACEVDKEKLWTAARVQQDYALGPRNYIIQFEDSLSEHPAKIDTWVWKPVAPYKLNHRLLPASLVDSDLRSAASQALADIPKDRERGDEPLVGQVDHGPIVVVQRLQLSSKELEEDSNPDEHRAPLPGWGSYLVVLKDGQSRSTLVKDLVPKWEAYFPRNDARDSKSAPSSPYRGIGAAWDGRNQIWLAVGAWDNRAPGGLWRTDDMGAHWYREPGIQSASDVFLMPDGDKYEPVLAQSAYEDQWTSVVRISFPPRLRRWFHGNKRGWEDLPSPPQGSESEVEICGSLDGSLVIRVDNAIYRQTKQPLWRWLQSASK